MPLERALEVARALRVGTCYRPGPLAAATRVVAIGDPQSTAARFLGALDARGLLADDGWLRPDVRLISLGDHFDYAVAEREAARAEGVLILGWLAAHAPEHVTIVAGNHDLVRVMELATVADDARFRAAADAARAIVALPRGERAAATAAFRAAYPEIPTPGYAARDYNAFTVEQRRLVQRLLLAGRFSLAAARDDLLFVHAGLTRRELGLLGLPDGAGAAAIAEALQARLVAAVAEVADAWRAGIATPLSLAPLYVAASDGEEAGGLLYHRPADLERPGADAAWERRADRPRRYDPRDCPRGLVQVVGHTGHRKTISELGRWRGDVDDAAGGLRTLRVTRDGAVAYRRGIERGDAEDAVLWMIDPEMHYVPTAADVAILELG